MATVLEYLISTLEEEVNIYKEMAVIGNEKKMVIAKKDMEMLKKMNVVENSLVNKLKKLDTKRDEAFQDIKMLLNIKSDVTLLYLEENLKDRKDREKIKALRSSIIQVSNELKRANEVNTSLLNNSLEFVEFNLNMVRHARSVDPGTYTKKDLGR
ncbi:MAG: flagellar protein FlgN [Lachnospirales bacterium]